MTGTVEKQQKPSEEFDRRWQRIPGVRKRARWFWQKKGKPFFVFFFLLSLGLELFPEGPFQLRNRQSEGEGAV